MQNAREQAHAKSRMPCASQKGDPSERAAGSRAPSVCAGQGDISARVSSEQGESCTEGLQTRPRGDEESPGQRRKEGGTKRSNTSLFHPADRLWWGSAGQPPVSFHTARPATRHDSSRTPVRELVLQPWHSSRGLPRAGNRQCKCSTRGRAAPEEQSRGHCKRDCAAKRGGSCVEPLRRVLFSLPGSCPHS